MEQVIKPRTMIEINNRLTMVEIVDHTKEIEIKPQRKC